MQFKNRLLLNIGIVTVLIHDMMMLYMEFFNIRKKRRILNIYIQCICDHHRRSHHHHFVVVVKYKFKCEKQQQQFTTIKRARSPTKQLKLAKIET